jgi:hypothetical protein
MECKWRVWRHQHHESKIVESWRRATDYVQSLQDESKIRAEKIGSGNWYWSFVADDKIVRQKALDVAQSAHDKALATDIELKSKLSEAQAQRRGDDEMLDEGGETREELLSMKKSLAGETEAIRRELATYSDNDPTELEKKVDEAAQWKTDTEGLTDDIYSMEGWLKDQLGGGEGLDVMLQETYGKEYDEEVRGLKELVWVLAYSSQIFRCCFCLVHHLISCPETLYYRMGYYQEQIE